ncbi:MAG TPA: NUDIX domain-containing protein, partial [Candidatus Competibacter sp.]|nr:NUDIX domain-containing protein [Candidatus Competibacter sp.]
MSAPEAHSFVHVAVGIVAGADGAVLIARRPDHVHQGGLWEFPGGKVEHGESVIAALGRELREELGIAVRAAEPLLQTGHAYP